MKFTVTRTPGVALQDPGHVGVGAGGVEPDPGQHVGPGGRLPVEGLVHVPEDGQPDRLHGRHDTSARRGRRWARGDAAGRRGRGRRRRYRSAAKRLASSMSCPVEAATGSSDFSSAAASAATGPRASAASSQPLERAAQRVRPLRQVLRPPPGRRSRPAGRGAARAARARARPGARPGPGSRAPAPCAPSAATGCRPGPSRASSSKSAWSSSARSS